MLWILNTKLLKTMQYIFEIIIPQCHHTSFFPQQLMMSLESYSAQWPAFHKGRSVNFAVGNFISRWWFWGTYRTRPPRSRDGGALQGLSIQSLYCRELPSGHLLGSHSPAIYKDNADPNLFSSQNGGSISQLVTLSLLSVFLCTQLPPDCGPPRKEEEKSPENLF